MLLRMISLSLLVLAIGLVGCSRENKTPVGDSGQTGGTSFADISNSAERGDAQAQLKLGLMYRYGDGTSRNVDEAVKWLRKSAEQGNIDAMSELYVAGLDPNGPNEQFLPSGYVVLAGGPSKAQNPLNIDQTEAMTWLKKATDKGDANSLFYMGRVYDAGLTGSKDINQAKAWYTRSANKDHAEAELTLALILLSENNGDAIKWLRQAATHGHPDAQVVLGDELMEGRFITKNDAEARSWYEKAAANGHDGAKQKLGR